MMGAIGEEDEAAGRAGEDSCFSRESSAVYSVVRTVAATLICRDYSVTQNDLLHITYGGPAPVIFKANT